MGSRIKMPSQNRLHSEVKKKKKFVPHKIPRYLPGSVQNTVLVQDLIEYNKHRYKVMLVWKCLAFILVFYRFFQRKSESMTIHQI